MRRCEGRTLALSTLQPKPAEANLPVICGGPNNHRDHRVFVDAARESAQTLLDRILFFERSAGLRPEGVATLTNEIAPFHDRDGDARSISAV